MAGTSTGDLLVRDWSKPVLAGILAGTIGGLIWSELFGLYVVWLFAPLLRLLCFDPWTVCTRDDGVTLGYLLRPRRTVLMSESRIDYRVGKRFVRMDIRNPFLFRDGLSTRFMRSSRNDLARVVAAST